MWRKKSTGPSLIIERKSLTGSHFNSTPMPKMSMSPSQKAGMDIPSSAKNISPWSMMVLAFHAARTPMGMAKLSAIISEAIASDSVGSMRSTTASKTGLLRKIDSPKSPLNIRPMNSPNWMCKGLCSPRLTRNCSMSSSLAFSPASTAAGSPGVRRNMRNATSATKKSTGMAATMRRMMYAVKLRLPLDSRVRGNDGFRRNGESPIHR